MLSTATLDGAATNICGLYATAIVVINSIQGVGSCKPIHKYR